MRHEIPCVGFEEEYQLVDPNSSELMPNSKSVMRTLRGDDEQLDAEVQHELHLNQIEIASHVCHSLEEVRQNVESTRATLADAAGRNGCHLASAGTHPMTLPEESSVTPKKRYRAMTDRLQQIARDLFIFGCHVHVEMKDRELGVRVMNRCRRWLPVLQAMTANSPYWDGEDTGYASYRRELWAQLPMAGPPPLFDGLDDYNDCVSQLIQCGAIRDESFLYWDIRLPTKVPTIEFRAADAMTRVEETVGYVGLVRAMVMQALADDHAGRPVPKFRPNVLTYAIWQAARYGTTGNLVDLRSSTAVDGKRLVQQTADELDDALNATGERESVDRYIEMVLDEGTGAARQRNSAGPELDQKKLVQYVVEETMASSRQTS